jgi:hypothetical protein
LQHGTRALDNFDALRKTDRRPVRASDQSAG